MNKVDFKKKVDLLLPELTECIRKECDRLYDCGGVSPSEYSNDFELPKLILSVAIYNQEHQYSPLHPAGKKVANNLKHF